jgi:uncharacterized protein DUF6526
MAERVQSFQKHVRWLPAFHFFMIPVLLANFLNELRHLVAQQTLHTVWMVVFAAALLTMGFLSRIQALTVQDRVIRLEMRLRLRGLLPPDMHPMIDDLTHRQMVALRFASDAELESLVRDIRDGKLQTSKDIKGRIKNWQADWLRA